jgi:sugar phosphate isomerase/epimerase
MSAARLMWSGTLGRRSVDERSAAAAAVGYTKLSAPFNEAHEWQQRGSLVEYVARAGEHGVELHVLDPIASWTPTEVDIPSARIDPLRGLDMAVEMSAPVVAAIALHHSAQSLMRLVNDFGAFCDAAEERGLQVALEFVPMSAIKDAATALHILDAVERPNAGLIFDTWHFFRGSPDLEVAQRLLPHVRHLQISDARQEVEGDLIRDTYLHRMLPGTGELPLQEVVDLVSRAPRLETIGPEVFSAAQHRKGPVMAAQQAVEALDSMLATAERHDHVLGGERVVR